LINTLGKFAMNYSRIFFSSGFYSIGSRMDCSYS